MWCKSQLIWFFLKRRKINVLFWEAVTWFYLWERKRFSRWNTFWSIEYCIEKLWFLSGFGFSKQTERLSFVLSKQQKKKSSSDFGKLFQPNRKSIVLIKVRNHGQEKDSNFPNHGWTESTGTSYIYRYKLENE